MGFRGLTPYDEIDVDGFTKIGNHGMIANNRSAALVSMNGTIDWACLPNFNSPPVFFSILDRKKGGYFRITPLDTSNLYVHQSYKDFTNVLITEFVRNNKVILRITDFMPTSEYSTISFPEIHRLVETLSEEVDVEVSFKVAFDYGRKSARIEERKHGYVFKDTRESVGLALPFKLERFNDRLSGTLHLPRRSANWFVALHGVDHIGKISDYKSYERLEETVNYWQKWCNQSTYNGLYHGDVIRSALTLKGLFYEPTGLMVAAPTTSLPECVGGERNWDYRYTWIRDTAYVIEALAMIGYKREATKFLYDLMHIIEREGRIRTIYSINEDSNLNEEELDLEGYRFSRPVRIGNKASEQLQLDEYGSIINAVYHLHKIGGLINSYLWDFVGETLDKISKIWRNPDSSIWEFRTEPKHYVYSKLMCWVAFTRAIEMGREEGFSGPYRKWKATADEIKEDILRNGYDPELNSFTQYYGSKSVDAALLRIPMVGFLPPDDPRITGTVERIEKELMVRNFLFKRYTEDDGFACPDNPFLLLSFWYVEDLIILNRVEEAKEVFESLLDKANVLGLFSEEVDLNTGELIGNFPQAITHLGVIRVATKLNEVLKRKNGKSGNSIDTRKIIDFSRYY